MNSYKKETMSITPPAKPISMPMSQSFTSPKVRTIRPPQARG